MQVSRIINAPIETVWTVLTDTSQWSLWGPSVRAVECSRQHLSAGLRGRVKTAFGLWASFQITRFEPPHYWDWQVAGIPATGHRLRQLAPGRCELSFEFPLLLFPYALICRRAMENIARLAEGSGAGLAAEMFLQPGDEG